LKTPCGSPSYAAPEILLNIEYDGKKADIWSLGVVLYAMATGSMPWNESNSIEMYRQIQECQIDIPPDLSLPLRSLLTMILARDPAQRPTIEKVLESSWLSESRGFVRANTTNYKMLKPQLSLMDSGSPYLGTRRPIMIRPTKEHAMTTDLGGLSSRRDGMLPGSITGLMRRVPPTGKRRTGAKPLFDGV
jgi:serine/threonine protein kinase